MIDITPYRISNHQNLQLKDFSTDVSEQYNWNKKGARDHLQKMNDKLFDYQRRIFVGKKHKVLIVLQGMDTSGKNGVIRNVFRGLNPQTIKVASFEKPTAIELRHDYLWRVHQKVPAEGEIVVFDRSHYEDILAVRVNHLKPVAIWEKRYQHINGFEKMLVDEGTTIIKIFLHISKEAQKERLQSRLDDPEKQWKFDESDLVARSRWNQYMKAYEDVFAKTDQPHAPWFIVPSDRKWMRDLIFAEILYQTFSHMHLRLPRINYDPKSVVID